MAVQVHAVGSRRAKREAATTIYSDVGASGQLQGAAALDEQVVEGLADTHRNNLRTSAVEENGPLIRGEGGCVGAGPVACDVEVAATTG